MEEVENESSIIYSVHLTCTGGSRPMTNTTHTHGNIEIHSLTEVNY
jgi:hypothetical protein